DIAAMTNRNLHRAMAALASASFAIAARRMSDADKAAREAADLLAGTAFGCLRARALAAVDRAMEPSAGGDDPDHLAEPAPPGGAQPPRGLSLIGSRSGRRGARRRGGPWRRRGSRPGARRPPWGSTPRRLREPMLNGTPRRRPVWWPRPRATRPPKAASPRWSNCSTATRKRTGGSSTRRRRRGSARHRGQPPRRNRSRPRRRFPFRRTASPPPAPVP